MDNATKAVVGALCGVVLFAGLVAFFWAIYMGLRHGFTTLKKSHKRKRKHQKHKKHKRRTNTSASILPISSQPSTINQPNNPRNSAPAILQTVRTGPSQQQPRTSPREQQSVSWLPASKSATNVGGASDQRTPVSPDESTITEVHGDEAANASKLRFIKIDNTEENQQEALSADVKLYPDSTFRSSLDSTSSIIDLYLGNQNTNPAASHSPEDETRVFHNSKNTSKKRRNTFTLGDNLRPALVSEPITLVALSRNAVANKSLIPKVKKVVSLPNLRNAQAEKKP